MRNKSECFKTFSVSFYSHLQLVCVCVRSLSCVANNSICQHRTGVCPLVTIDNGDKKYPSPHPPLQLNASAAVCFEYVLVLQSIKMSPVSFAAKKKRFFTSKEPVRPQLIYRVYPSHPFRITFTCSLLFIGT